VSEKGHIWAHGRQHHREIIVGQKDRVGKLQRMCVQQSHPRSRMKYIWSCRTLKFVIATQGGFAVTQKGNREVSGYNKTLDNLAR